MVQILHALHITPQHTCSFNDPMGFSSILALQTPTLHIQMWVLQGCLPLLLWDSGPCFSRHTPIVVPFLRTLLCHAANWQPSPFDSQVCECIWACLLNSYCVRKNENMTGFSNPSGDVYEMIQSMKQFYKHHNGVTRLCRDNYSE